MLIHIIASCCVVGYGVSFAVHICYIKNKTRRRGLTFIEEVVPVTRYQYNSSLESYFSGG